VFTDYFLVAAVLENLKLCIDMVHLYRFSHGLRLLFFIVLYRQIYTIDNAHGQLVRDMDFNPNRQYIIATCGDDCRTKFWDLRSSDKPLKILDDHSHWLVCNIYANIHACALTPHKNK